MQPRYCLEIHKQGCLLEFVNLRRANHVREPQIPTAIGIVPKLLFVSHYIVSTRLHILTNQHNTQSTSVIIIAIYVRCDYLI